MIGFTSITSKKSRPISWAIGLWRSIFGDLYALGSITTLNSWIYTLYLRPVPSCSWSFPTMPYPPVIIHFPRIFHDINHPANCLGVSHEKTPNPSCREWFLLKPLQNMSLVLGQKISMTLAYFSPKISQHVWLSVPSF